MKYTDYLLEMIESSSETLFRTARTMPEDKLEWQAEGKGRSVIDQLQECAQAPKWFLAIIQNMDNPPDFDPETYQQMMEERKQWTTIDLCEENLKKNQSALVEAIKNYPEEQLKKEVKLSFSEKPFTAADMMLGHYWNMTYHIGQINFIQTLYGDNEMH